MNQTKKQFFDQDDHLGASLAALEQERTLPRPVSERAQLPDHADSAAEPLHKAESFERGMALKKAGLFKQAAAHFEHATRDPAYAVKALAQMGLCFKRCGKLEDAVTAFQRAVQKSSGSSQEQVPILYLLGKTLEALGRTPDALETYRWIRREDPGYRDVANRIERLSSHRTNAGLPKPPAASSESWLGDILKSWHGVLRSHK